MAISSSIFKRVTRWPIFNAFIAESPKGLRSEVSALQTAGVSAAILISQVNRVGLHAVPALVAINRRCRTLRPEAALWAFTSPASAIGFVRIQVPVERRQEIGSAFSAPTPPATVAR
jgi:hypothetical protein